MEATKKIKQLLYDYVTAGLIEGDPIKVLSYLSDDVIGIGMGEQGYICSKKEVQDIMLTTIKKDASATYELDISKVIINFITETTASVCATIHIKRFCKGQETTSGFMQSLTMVYRNHTWYICALHASPIMLSEESIDTYPMAFADNTLAHLRSELQIETFQLVNQSLSGGILITYIPEENALPFYFANDNMIQMLEYEKQDFIQTFEKNTCNLIFSADRERVLSSIVSAIKENHEFELCYRLVKKDGTIIWVIERGKKTKNNKGHDIILAVFTDVTKFFKMQETLKEKTLLLEEQAEELAAQNIELLEQRQILEEQTKALAISEERFRLALEKTSNVIFDYDIISGTIIHSSAPKKVMNLTNIKSVKENLIMDGIIMDNYITDFEAAFDKIRNGIKHVDCIVKAKLTTGKEIWNKISMTGVSDQEGTILRAVGLIEDITQQKEAEIAYKREEQYRQALVLNAMSIYIVNFTKGIFENCEIMDERCTPVNPGQSYDSFIKYLAKVRLDEKERVPFLEIFSRVSVMEAFDEKKQEITFEYNALNPDGSSMWMENILRLVIDSTTNEKKGFIYVMDIDKRKRKELALTHKLECDPLTGLYNKSATEKYIQDKLESTEGIISGTFMMIDIDYFKEINDTFGHPFGDSILKQVAKALKENFRDSDIVGRIGGDEFCVFLSSIPSNDRIAKTAHLLCEKIHSIVLPSENTNKISCSIGISRCNGYIKTFQEIYGEADLALYSIKNSGRNGYAFFEQLQEHIS